MDNSFFKPDTQVVLKSLLTDVKGYFGAVSLARAIVSNLPGFLADKNRSLNEICEFYHWSPVPTRLLCDTLVLMEWLESDADGCYRNSSRMLVLLPELSKLSPLVDDWERGMSDMSGLADLLEYDSWNQGKVAEKYSYTRGAASTDETDKYSVAMLDSVEPMAESLVERIDFSRYRKILEVGGGYGGLAHRIRLDNPDIEWVGVMDLPPAEAGFKKLQEKGELDPRLHFIPGDFFTSGLKNVCDCIVLNRILFDWNDEKAEKIIDMCSAALNSGGKLIVHEGCYRLDFNRIAASWLHFLVGGRLRTCEEVRSIIISNDSFVVERVLESKIPDWYIFMAEKIS